MYSTADSCIMVTWLGALWAGTRTQQRNNRIHVISECVLDFAYGPVWFLWDHGIRWWCISLGTKNMQLQTLSSLRLLCCESKIRMALSHEHLQGSTRVQGTLGKYVFFVILLFLNLLSTF